MLDNPAVRMPGSMNFCVPIRDAQKARTAWLIRRSMAFTCAGPDNKLFYMEKTMMLFGDARETAEDIVNAIG